MIKKMQRRHGSKGGSQVGTYSLPEKGRDGAGTLWNQRIESYHMREGFRVLFFYMPFVKRGASQS